MEVHQGGFDLVGHLSALSLQPRQTGLVAVPSMPWAQPGCSTTREFKHIYISRLDQLGPRLQESKKVEAIAQVVEDKDTYCIRGIVKRLESKRVRAFEKDFQQKYDGSSSLVSMEDELELEDKTGKIKFHLTEQTSLNISAQKPITNQILPSGVCLTMIGRFRKRVNKFVAKEIFFPSVAPQSCLLPHPSCSQKKLLVCSQPSKELCQKVKNIVMNTCPQSLNITALVIIGGIRMTPEEITWMGLFLEEVKDHIDVFLMPSSDSERSRLFPLKPYSDLFFPRVSEEVGLCSNPQLFEGDNGVQIVATCGQNVKDFLNNCDWASSELEAMEMMVLSGHYCPTSPFSLKTEPFGEDFLVMERLPHVMVSGKGRAWGSKRVKVGQGEVTLISIPERKMALVGLDGIFARELL